MPRRSVAAIVTMATLSAFPALAHATTYSAFAGADNAPGAPKQASPNAFFPRTLTIHRGDTVRWSFRGFHTVTFPVKGRQPPPLAVANPGVPVSGENDAAGKPFWFNGRPNILLNRVAIAKSTSTTYTGRRLVGSGLPSGAKPAPFVLRFPRSGKFTYYCTVHPGMKATVRVVSPARAAPTPARTVALRKRQISAYVAAAKRSAAAAPPSGATVQVGRANSVFTLNAMFPASLTVRPGQPVTFTMAGQARSEVHTVTFGPAAVRSGLRSSFVEPIKGAPPPGLGLNPRAVYSSDPPPLLPPYDGTNHGDGFFNSGLLDNNPATPFPNVTRITFTKPGTYDYVCVVHTGMDGRIVVM